MVTLVMVGLMVAMVTMVTIVMTVMMTMVVLRGWVILNTTISIHI